MHINKTAFEAKVYNIIEQRFKEYPRGFDFGFPVEFTEEVQNVLRRNNLWIDSVTTEVLQAKTKTSFMNFLRVLAGTKTEKYIMGGLSRSIIVPAETTFDDLPMDIEWVSVTKTIPDLLMHEYLR